MPQQQVLSAQDPLSIQIRDEFFPGSDIIEVPRFGDGPSGQCYTNARALAEKCNGRPLLGWMLTSLTGHFGEALHHAVIELPTGEILDVTAPAFEGADYSSAAFIADRQQKLGKIDPCVPSKFIQLDNERATEEYIALTVDRMRLSGRMNEIFIEHFEINDRYPFPPSFSVDPRHPALSQIRSLQEQINRLQHRRSQYFRRFMLGNFERLPS
ncbi:hypothetical protein JET14_11880 [Martelella lutilitoris]|uniref:Uncharacterized protein n=1 Tax=Martelella lutilitoris TaxID=2583532 RepID=A0A7T7HH57_9HYPH|nr:hypothetical protein [Martelella lutilitoris]QQM29039.1 hypothetical protein JET14_11880 [Martelella lutilitoris]